LKFYFHNFIFELIINSVALIGDQLHDKQLLLLVSSLFYKYS